MKRLIAIVGEPGVMTGEAQYAMRMLLMAYNNIVTTPGAPWYEDMLHTSLSNVMVSISKEPNNDE